MSGPQGDKAYVVTGGFAQITSEGTSVLAEQAMALADVKGADIDALVTQAQAAAGAATADAKDTAEKLVADLQALRADVA